MSRCGAALPDGGCVLAVHGKGGRTRHVALPAVRTRSGRAMTPHGVRQVVKAAARRAGIAAAPSPHWLRHACASHSLDRGAPVHVVQQTLGHASLATTSRCVPVRPGRPPGPAARNNNPRSRCAYRPGSGSSAAPSASPVPEAAGVSGTSRVGHVRRVTR